MNQLDHGDYVRFSDLVLRQSGLHFPEKKRADLAHGLFKALESQPQFSGNLHDYYQFLQQAESAEARAELDRLINLLTIGETHFFRDSAQFNALISHVLPPLLEHKRAAARAAGSNTPHIRLWSAGCATGEEAYSLAMLLRESIPDIDNWRVVILGTDINDESLAQARHAVYSDWSFREQRALSLRPTYFTSTDRGYQLSEEIQQMVTFARHNLIEEDFPAVANNTIAMDVIMCRNVTIYFAENTTRQLVKKFYSALADNGWLIVGHAEPSLFNYRDFQVHNLPGAVLYQKNRQRLSPAEPEPQLSRVHSQLASDAVKPDPRDSDKAKKGPRVPGPALAKAIQTRPKPPRRTGQLPITQWDPAETWQLDPYRAARNLLSQGQIERAIVTLQGAMHVFSIRQRPYACCLLARAYADQGDWQQARQWGEKALQLDKLLAEAYLVLAMIDEQDNRVAEAIANLKKAIYLEREQPLAHFHLAVLYMKQGQRLQARRAIKNCEKILASWPADRIIADSGGTSAGQLLDTVHQMQAQSEFAAKEEQAHGK